MSPKPTAAGFSGKFSPGRALWGALLGHFRPHRGNLAHGGDRPLQVPEQPRRSRRPWRPGHAWTAVLLTVSLVATGLAYGVPPAAAANGTGPADLINVLELEGASPLYTATPAQQASLQDLEQQAVTNTISDHGLSSSDAAAVQTWGRDAAEGELWALLVQAINTAAAQQTTDQANAVAWLSNVVLQQNTIAADDAGLEYAKWAGLGAGAYQSMLTTNPSEATLQNLLSADPLNYASGESESTPESTSNEGYCLYEPPAPDSSQYGANIYSNQGTDQDCYTPCTDILSDCSRTPARRASSWPGARPTPTKSVNNSARRSLAMVDEATGAAAAVGAGATPPCLTPSSSALRHHDGSPFPLGGIITERRVRRPVAADRRRSANSGPSWA